ncbi:putative magnesium transport MgtC family protein [Sphaerisporangium rufum]|uniref:Magnesium transport MgtC family protein n=2 Tax=Sphaerisporangium rufum TaxID=1381558 RepID=A0A919V308_9ACTN|nr:putative magnesium transport MgtC family protein [Sphaerisporangium rufum]
MAAGVFTGQGWAQLGELALAFLLSALIGLEREFHQKSAGLRTHALVGFGAALLVLVSKHGFDDVVGRYVTLDPSRVAAQIVSGIGFIGAGLIFIRRDAVRGLTTAATVWLTAAVGMAAGAGLWLLALVVTGGHFAVTVLLSPLVDRLPRSRYAPSRLHLSCAGGEGVLRRVISGCTERGFGVSELSVDRRPQAAGTPAVSVWLSVRGKGSVPELVAGLADIEGVLAVLGMDGDAAP